MGASDRMVAGVKHPMPVLRRAIEHHPEQRQAAAFAGKPTDDRHATPRLAEGAFDDVRVADALVVLVGKSQVSRQGLDVIEQARDRCGIRAAGSARRKC
jgi:hypothetical protein